MGSSSTGMASSIAAHGRCFLTSAFVHSPVSLLHIMFNMYILWAFGPVLERTLGRVKFLLLYVASLLGG